MTEQTFGDRVVYLRVVWNGADHGWKPDEEPDWAYHLRMGDIDCEDAEVVQVEQVGWLEDADTLDPAPVKMSQSQAFVVTVGVEVVAPIFRLRPSPPSNGREVAP